MFLAWRSILCYFTTVRIVLAINNPSQLSSSSRDEIIQHYFNAGFSYKEILAFLINFHGISICLRQLFRILKSLGLHRRKCKDSINSVMGYIHKELSTSASCFGYRTMHQKMRAKGFVVDRETVRLSLKFLDPEGTEFRSRHRLRRRVYRSKGPNFMWHLDGYDKLKPFGFDIHGAIDGYSRKLLWLNVLPSNHNPKIIASLFVQCVSKDMIVPQILRSDRGSENVIVGGMQRYFRRSFQDSFARNLSFRYGSSTANQRIEAWWSIMRRIRFNWWINYFKDLVDEGVLDTSLNYHIESLRFCFMGIIQNELDETLQLWNNHRIREVRNSECPGGRPDILYYLPDQPGIRDCSFSVSLNDLVLCKSRCQPLSVSGCSNAMLKFSILIMKEYNISIPDNAADAKKLYLKIVNNI